MRTSFGHPLPQSEQDFQDLPLVYKRYVSCEMCSQRFTSGNTHTPAGWAETQTSGLCEDCFDGLFKEN